MEFVRTPDERYENLEGGEEFASVVLGFMNDNPFG